VIHLGSHLNLRRIVDPPLASPASAQAAGRCLLSSPRNFFPRGPLTPELEARAQIRDARSGVLRDVTSAAVGEADGTAC